MKRTNIVLNEHLVRKALATTGLKTQREVVDFALRELLRHEDLKILLALKGRVTWEGELSALRRWRAMS